MPEDIGVIGTRVDTLIAKEWSRHEVLDIPDWTMQKNKDWIQSLIDRQLPVYKVSPENIDTLWDAEYNRARVFAEKLRQLREAGYVDVDDYLLPPKYGAP